MPSEITTQDKELIEQMLADHEISAEADAQFRRLAVDDLRFEAAFDENGKSTQWSAEDLARWQAKSAPAVTLDHFSEFPNQVINDFRQRLPSGQIIPVGSESDPETAEVLQGIIRSIEQNCHARIAYETAFSSAVKCGFGAWRVLFKHTFQNPQTAEEFRAQHIEIKAIKNPFTIFYDPNGVEPDGSDWEFCEISEFITEKKYRRLYGKTKLGEMSNWSNVGTEFDLPPEWMQNGFARIAEYFYTKHKTIKKVLFSDDQLIEKNLLEATFKKYGNYGLPEGVTEVETRDCDVATRHWIKSDGVNVLDRADWPGQYIPVVPVFGSELNIAGKKLLYGMIRNAKDAQRGLNYMFSKVIQAIGLMPISPLMIPVGSGADGPFKEIYAKINEEAFAAIPYLAFTEDGKQLPPPHRASFTPDISPMVSAINHLQYTMKATQGMYGSSLGEPAGEKSGLAIQARTATGDKATFHYQSNAERSMWHNYRLVLDLAPHVYTSDTVMQIMGKDDKPRQITVDHRIPVEERPQAASEGRYNLKAGKYDVVIVVGQSYPTQRQETVSKLSEILKTWGPAMPPQAMQVLMIGLLKHVDIPGGKEMADELEKIFASLKPGAALPPQVQQQMQQMGQQLQMMAQQLQQAKQREVANAAAIQSKERIAAMDRQVEMRGLELQAAIKEVEFKSREAMEQWKIDAAATDAELERAAGQEHERRLQAMDHSHEAGMAAAEAAMQPEPAAPVQ